MGALALSPGPWHFASMTDELPLAAEFPPATREDWLKLVRAALKDRPFERLIGQDLRRHPDRAAVSARGERPAGRGARAAPGGAWRGSIIPIRPRPTPRRCTNWQNGATGLTLVFAGSLGAYGYGLPGDAESLARVLDGVHLDAHRDRIADRRADRGTPPTMSRRW